MPGATWHAAPADEARLVRDFLAHSRALEQRLRATLEAGDAEVARNSQLVWTWDSLSLGLLLDWAPFTAAPTCRPPTGAADLELCAGRHPAILGRSRRGAGRAALRGAAARPAPAPSDDALQAALDAAPWETVRFPLQPAGAPPPTI